MAKDINRHAEEFFKDCDMGDKRLQARLIDIASRFMDSESGSIASVCQDDSAASLGAYRFFSNENVSVSDIMSGGFSATVKTSEDFDELLLIGDTTTISFKHSVSDDLGDIGAPPAKTVGGWLVHNSILLDGQGRTIGLMDQYYWQRDKAERGKKHSRAKRNYEDKESYKWQLGVEAVANRMGSAMEKTIIVVDREADVYEFIENCLTNNRRFVIRSSHDRKTDADGVRTREFMSSLAPLGEMEVDVQQKGGRVARTAKVSVRASQLEIQSPNKKNVSEKLTLNCVWLREENVCDSNKPLDWLLWTTEDVSTFEKAVRVQQIYSYRWRIEEFHKAWKSGCKVEEQRLHSPDALHRLSVVLAFVAVWILKLKELNQYNPDKSCENYFTKDQWQCLWKSVEKKKKVPRKYPSIRWAYYAIARLGGWTDTKRTGRVGWKAIWKGILKLNERMIGWMMAKM